MIITEIIEINGKQFTRNYSNAGRYVVRDGVNYEEAVDPIEFNRQYIEGDVIETEEPTDEQYAQVGKIMLGKEE